jgi:nitrate/nitrite transporter NarK
LSWRAVFIILSVPGFLWAFGFYAWFRNRPAEHRRVNATELALIRETTSTSASSADDRPGPTPWLLLLQSRAMWCICSQQFFRAAGYIFYSTWFPKFLEESWGITPKEAGFLTSMPLIAVMLGTLIGGSLSDLLLQWTGSRVIGRKVLAMVSLTLSGVFILLATLAGDAVLEVAIISIGSFCSGCGNPVSYAITLDMGGKHTTSVFSTMNMMGNFGAAAFPIVAAWFVDWTGHWAYHVSPLKDQVGLVVITISRASNWHSLLYLFAGIYFCAAASWIFLNPNETIAEEAKG